jgi:hypothetical protein
MLMGQPLAKASEVIDNLRTNLLQGVDSPLANLLEGVRKYWQPSGKFLTRFGNFCKYHLSARGLVIPVPDSGEEVCADPVNRGAILEGEGPGPPSGDKERQLSPDKGRGKT